MTRCLRRRTGCRKLDATHRVCVKRFYLATRLTRARGNCRALLSSGPAIHCKVGESAKRNDQTSHWENKLCNAAGNCLMLSYYSRCKPAPWRVGLWTRKVNGAVFRKPHASNYLNLLTVIGATWRSGKRVLGRLAMPPRRQGERAHHACQVRFGSCSRLVT